MITARGLNNSRERLVGIRCASRYAWPPKGALYRALEKPMYARPLIIVKFVDVYYKFRGLKTRVYCLRSWSW